MVSMYDWILACGIDCRSLTGSGSWISTWYSPRLGSHTMNLALPACVYCWMMSTTLSRTVS